MIDRKTHLRIDFVIQEVADDDTPASELRHISFGDDVPIVHVRDFFQRCMDAMGLLFKTGNCVVCLVDAGPNKIGLIKVIRELTGHGLKDAKDFVEGPTGTALFTTRDHYSLQHAIQQINATGAKVEVRSYIPEGDRYGHGGIKLPPLMEYVRPA